jgi:hypothetical protein
MVGGLSAVYRQRGLRYTNLSKVVIQLAYAPTHFPVALSTTATIASLFAVLGQTNIQHTQLVASWEKFSSLVSGRWLPDATDPLARATANAATALTCGATFVARIFIPSACNCDVVIALKDPVSAGIGVDRATVDR